MTKHNRLKRNFILLIGVVALFSFFHIVFIFNYVRNEIKNQQTRLADMNIQTLKERLYSDTDQLEILAAALERKPNGFWHTDEANYLIDDFLDNTHFTKIALADADGMMYLVGGREPVDISDQSHFQFALQGKISMQSFVKQVNGEDIRKLTIGVPVYNENNVGGVLIGSYALNELNSLLPTELMDHRIRSFIVRSDGHIIINGAGKSTFDTIDDLWASEKTTIIDQNHQIITESVTKNKRGTISYTIDGDEHYLISTPVNFSDDIARIGVARWNLLVDVPAKYIVKKAAHLLLENMTYSMLILGLFTLFSIGFYREKNKEYSLAESMSRTDVVTGSLNRRGLVQEFEGRVSEGGSYTLFLIDLDNFKQINDRLGHLAGDRALIHFSKMLSQISGEMNGFCGRLGGDEFLLCIPEGQSDAAEKLAQNLIDHFIHKFHKYCKAYNFGITIGITFSPKHGNDFYTLMEKADKALYLGKRSGKNCYVFVTSEASEEETSIEAESQNKSANPSNAIKIMMNPHRTF